MKARLTTRTYVACPNCGESEHRVDHLFGDPSFQRSFGPWSCSECGSSFTGKIKAPEEIELTLTATDKCDVPCYDLLVLPPQRGPVFFLLEARDYNRTIGGAAFEGKQYLYEEHTCPTNWTSQIVRIISEGDHDPHGLFEYVGSVDRPREADDEHEGGAATELMARYQPGDVEPQEVAALPRP